MGREGARRDRSPRARPSFSILLLLFLPGLLLSADPLVKRAQEAEKAGNGPLAARLYSDWLRAYPGAPGSARIFSSYFRAERDFAPLLKESRAFLVAGKGCPGAGEEFLRIAKLFDLAGMIEESRDAYLAAFAEGVPGSALLSAALLSVEMNDAGALAESLSRTEGETAKSLLAALAALQSGDYEAAKAELTALASSTDDQELVVKTLWVLYRAASYRGDIAAVSLGSSQLGSRFAGSPEAAMAAGSGARSSAAADQLVRPFLSPLEMQSLSVQAVDPAAAAVATAPGSRPDTLYSIQAGSFQVKENADYLAADLVKKGFTPTVVQDTFQGKDRYRVFAGTGLVGDDARALLARLTKAGYSGFLTTGS